MRKINYVIIAVILSLLLVFPGCDYLPDITVVTPTPSTTATSTPATATPEPSSEAIDPDWNLSQQPGESSLLPDIADVVAEVRPSVVAINTEVITYDIFNRAYTQEGAGSGWIIDEEGIIVTNNHVVEDAETVTVTLYDDRVYEAETILTDSLTDLAIIKVAADNIPAANIGVAAGLEVGEWVVAIGNPLGLGISAKEGIVSRLGVPLTVDSGQTLYDLVETSAAINPGNSGGPLVNMAGEVIGITSAKMSSLGVEGMGYAINIDSALPIIEELVTSGYVTRPWLGVGMYTVDTRLAQRYSLAVESGVIITEVVAGSPANLGGLETGDIIVTFDGSAISDVEELRQVIHSGQIGDRVDITYWRDSSRRSTTITLVESPPTS
jgi:serine protease Do